MTVGAVVRIVGQTCPECGGIAAVIGRDPRHADAYGYYCNTKGCKHYHKSNHPWTP